MSPDFNTIAFKVQESCQVLGLTPVIPTIQEAEIRKITVPSRPGQIVCEIVSQKTHHRKRAGGVLRVVEFLPSKHEVLSSNPSAAKNNK
jgi:hypothetical protein